MSDGEPPRRRWPSPSPFVLMIAVFAVIIVGLLGLISLKPAPAVSAPTQQDDATTSGQRGSADAKAWQDNEARRAADNKR